MRHARQAMNDYLETVDFSKTDSKTGQLVHSVKSVNDNIIGMPKSQAAMDEMEEKVRQEMLDSFRDERWS
jgi:hypothetical protein